MRRQSVGSLTDLQFYEEFSLTDTRVASSMLVGVHVEAEEATEQRVLVWSCRTVRVESECEL